MCCCRNGSQAEEHFLKHEAQRAKKIASKSHRERIKELNEVRGSYWGLKSCGVVQQVLL